MRDKGIAANEISPSRKILVPHTALWVAPEGHRLFDPRSLDPVNDEMTRDMVARVKAGEQPNTDALYVWETQVEIRGKWQDVLVVGDGHGRTGSLNAAAKLLGKGTILMVEVELHTGDEKSFLLERARRNDHDRFARKDSRSVLAFRVKQLLSAGVTAKEIAAVCPREIGPAEVDALDRWDALTLEAKARFEAGAPIALLPTIVELPSSRQIPELDRLEANGVRTKAGATRARNKARDERDPWARRMSPKQANKLADILAEEVGATKPEKDKAWLVAAGVWLATNRDPHGLLELLPEHIRIHVQAFREARAAKGKRA